jgi:hypothetical protein
MVYRTRSSEVPVGGDWRRMRKGLLLISGVLLVGGLAACSSSEGTAPEQSPVQHHQGTSPTVAPTHSSATEPTLLNLNAENSWHAACVLPIATVAAQTAALGTKVTETDPNQPGDDECFYDDSPTSALPSLDIQLREYDSTTSYGTDGGSVSWHAPTPAAGYQQACTAYAGQCITGIGDGVVLSSDQGTAQVFLNGPYFYELQFYELGGSAASGQVLLSLARELVTAPAPQG